MIICSRFRKTIPKKKRECPSRLRSSFIEVENKRNVKKKCDQCGKITPEKCRTCPFCYGQYFRSKRNLSLRVYIKLFYLWGLCVLLFFLPIIFKVEIDESKSNIMIGIVIAGVIFFVAAIILLLYNKVIVPIVHSKYLKEPIFRLLRLLKINKGKMSSKLTTDNKQSQRNSKMLHKKTRRSPKFVIWATSIGLIFLLAYMANDGYFGIFPLVPLYPKTTTLTCNYAGKNLKLDLKLYGNIANYYRLHDLDKKDNYLKNEDFSKFVYSNPKDKTIKNLAVDIYELAYNNKITGNGDQFLEISTCFLQNIPYDSNKSNEVIKGTGNSATTEQYPYQTLYLNKGICTDKTYLGSALVKEIGFGTGIFVFDKDEHVSLGVSVPDGYSSFSSKYAIMELTNTGFAPGSIPSFIDKGTPTPKINNINQISENDDPDNISVGDKKEISPPTKVIEVSAGRSYSKIKTIKDLEKTIDDAIASLSTRKANLQKQKSNIVYWNNMQAQLYAEYLAMPSITQSCYPSFSYYPYYSSRQNCYSSINISKNIKYSSYSTAFNNYKNAISKYDYLVNDYNKTVDNINSAVNIWKSYQYN